MRNQLTGPWPLAALLLALALLLGHAAPATATTNPFTGRPAAEAPDRPEAAPGAARGLLAFVGRALLTFNREANRQIGAHMRAIRDGETSWPFLVGLGLAFLYGVVHALGPGHGKLFVVSYFLSREARIGRGLLMGTQIAVFHVLSALVIVLLADFVLRQAFGAAPAEVPGIRLASYGLIALIGLVMLVQALRRSWLRHRGVAVAPPTCCDHHHDQHQKTPGQVEQGTLSLGVGLVPCTGSVLILLYAVANDILPAGLLLVGAIAAGMAITMGGLGVLTVVARQAVAARVEGGSGGGRLAVVTDYAGALAITMLGSLLLLASM